MAVPSTFADLSTTPGSNSVLISDSTAVNQIDNHLQSVYALIASIYANSGNGWTSPFLPVANPSYTGVLTGPLGSVTSPTYTFTGDTNTGAWSPVADTYALSTGGTERMRITSAGDVGIGSTSPQAQLHLNSAAGGGDVPQMMFSNSGTGATASDGAFVGLTNTNELSIWNRESSNVRFATANTERMRIDSSGNVGIGVTPTTKLDIFNSANNYVYVRSSATSASGIELAGNGNTAGTSSFSLLQDSSSNAYVLQRANAFLAFGTNNTERMRIDSSGNVLVGTNATDSTNKLQVAGRIGATGFANSNGAYPAFSASILQGFPTFGFAFNLNVENAANNSYGVGILTTASGVQAERMRIDSSGYLNIGQVASGPTDATGVSVGPASGGADFNHISGTASGVMYSRFNLAATTIGSITQSGTTAVLYNTTSDGRLKTNITPAADAGALLDAVRVRQFDWLADGSHQRYGFIAQELVEVVPEAVHAPADPDEMMAVDYSKLVPLLVREIQALRQRVAALEA